MLDVYGLIVFRLIGCYVPGAGANFSRIINAICFGVSLMMSCCEIWMMFLIVKH